MIDGSPADSAQLDARDKACGARENTPKERRKATAVVAGYPIPDVETKAALAALGLDDEVNVTLTLANVRARLRRRSDRYDRLEKEQQ